MPFQRATLTQLRDDALQDIADAQIYDTTTGQLAAVTLFESSPLRCMAYDTAGGVYSAYGYLDWIAEQSTPWGATDERAAGWGALKGVTQKPAAFASGAETVTGPNLTDIPAGTGLSTQSGTTYATLADVTIGASGTATITFQATVAGAAGNAPAGTQLGFTTPVAGLPGPIVTANPITGGADIETAAAFKARYLQAYAEPVAGGSETDYPQWAEDVPGVTRAWCVPLGMGAGTVVVYTMWDLANAQWSGFPQGGDGVATADLRDAAAQGDQLTVANAIFALRPVTALVYSCAPVAWPVDFELANLGVANNEDTKAAIQASLAAMFLRLGSPVGGAPAVIYPNAIEAAINAVPGVANFTVLSPSPTAPLQPGPGQLPVVGTVSGTF